MALPTTISSVVFRALTSQGRTRPYISSAGNVYVFLVQSADASVISVQKATDPTSSFSEIATVDITATQVGMGTFQDGDNIHIATAGNDEQLEYHVFSMSSDTFTTSNEDTTGETDNIDNRAISISLETDGSIIIFYQGASDIAMGAKTRVDRAYKPSGGGWTVDQAVDAGGVVNYFLGGIVRGEANKFHLTFKDDTNNDAKHRSVQDVDGTLSTVEDLNDSNTSGLDFVVIPPVYYDDDGVERITACWGRVNSTRVMTSEIDDDGTPGAQEVASDIADLKFGEFNASVIAVDVKTVWLLYSDSSSSDVFSDSNDNSGGWGADVEELDAITCNLITSNVYQRGSDIVLAHVYDDGGTIKYNEKVLRTVADGPAAGLRTLALTGVGI